MTDQLVPRTTTDRINVADRLRTVKQTPVTKAALNQPQIHDLAGRVTERVSELQNEHHSLQRSLTPTTID